MKTEEIIIILLKNTLINWRFWIGAIVGAIAFYLAINTQLCFFGGCG